MIGDKTIYQKIGGILIDEAPKDAKKLTMTAFDLSENGEGCSFKFHWYDKENKKSWFIPNHGVTTEILGDMLFELRNAYIANGQPSWNGCIYSLELESGKFEFDLTYPT